MIKLTYILTLPSSYGSVTAILTDDTLGILTAYREYSISSNCLIDTGTTVENAISTITTMYIWPDRAAADEFFVFANSFSDYNAIYTSIQTSVEAVGGTFQRIEEEILP
jgi:hypothetical protein